MKRFVLLTLLISALFITTVAGAEETTAGSVPDEYSIHDDRESITVTNLNESFDQDFLAFINAQNEKENYIVSPLSFRAALILAVEGANNSTRAQLICAMGFASEEEMLQWYSAVRESVESFDEW